MKVSGDLDGSGLINSFRPDTIRLERSSLGERATLNRPAFRMARPVARLREGRADWFRIENKASSDTASVYIYDEIGYVGVTAKDFVSELQQIKAPNIELHLDTPGGNVWDGVSIYNAIRDHDSHVTVIVDAMAASAGSFIAQAGDHRIMNRHSEMMIHDAHGMVVGNSADLAEAIEMMDRLSDKIAGIYADHAGGTPEQWRDLMRKESWYSADEAVAAGLADEVVSKAGAKNTSQNSFDLSVFSYAGRENAPAPVTSEPEAKQEQAPEEPQGTDWTPFIDALKGAFA
jgi:ATP-dependent Clp endopeptidase proteolytic subunit ClpP